ncbi:serine hydrolase domain-containing protein [Bacillus sp. JJ1474]|uniref:serine hydrolase domain-containing protein n=2 Tax=unclassified Bacillus (in: firmicutes) TaxID=185979 RepID=UPI002FFD6AE3
MKKIISMFFIVGLFLFPLTTFAEMKQVPSGLKVDQLEETVDHIMEKYIRTEIPGASLAIVKDGKVLLLKGYGLADIEQELAVDPEKTVFEAGSVSKLYTWSAVMQLMEQGKLDLKTDIREYLPENYLNLTFPDKVTMLDLINHTAGFEDKADQLLTTDPEKVIPLEKFLSSEYYQPKQVFKPGTVIAYSNYSTSLAGLIVERVSGKSYADYMQENIIERLGMPHSTFATNYLEIPKIADFKGKSYRKNGDHFEAVDWAFVNDAPAGSLNTTAADMAQFMIAQLGSENNSLFEHMSTLEKMHEQTYQVHELLPGNAHGFWERYSGEYRLLEHGGNVIGYTSQLTLVPEEKFGYVLLMNVANEMTGLRVDLVDKLIGKNEPIEHGEKSENDEVVQGTYRMARGLYTNFLKLLPIVGNIDVTIQKNPQGGINFISTMAPEPIHYIETSPLLYERAEDTLTLLDKSGIDTSRIAFDLDDKGNVIKMSHGVISDYLPVKLKERVDINLAIILISVITFILYTIVFAVRWGVRKLKKKEKGNLHWSTPLLSGAGLLVIVNSIILFSRFTSDPFQPLSQMRIHVWINWLFPIMTVVCAYFIFKHFKNSKIFGKITQLLLLFVCFIFNLFLLNFYLI